MKRPAMVRGALLAAVFLSGAAGLIYETLWVRMLSLTLGSTTQAVTFVLTLFMGGLAAGSFWLGRRADLSRNPLGLYALMEAGLGLYALATPAALLWVGSPWAVLLMAPPAFLMGGTLPVLARWIGPEQPGGVAKLYFWNTLGGAAGCLATGLWLVPGLGVSRSLLATALLSFLVAAAVWLLSRMRQEAPVCSPAAEPSAQAQPLSRATWLIFALSGAAVMAYETLWTRLLALVLGSSAYAFTLVLAAFLCGIAIGARLAQPWVDRARSRLGVFGLLQLGIAATSLAGLALFNQLPFTYLRFYGRLGAGPFFGVAEFSLAAGMLLGPAILMGMSFPWFARMAQTDRRFGENVGTAYAVNTVGAMLGPVLAAFVLIPLLGLSGAAGALVLLNVVLGVWAMSLEPKRGFRLAAPWAAAALLLLWSSWPGIPAAVLHSGVSVYGDEYLAKGLDRAAWEKFLRRRKLLFSRDGAHGSVSVWEAANGRRSLLIDGKTDASDNAADMNTQLMLGHLPLLLSGGKAAPAPRVLVIGLGSGATAAAAARHRVRAIEIVEIEPAVVEAASYFTGVNRGVLRDPRVRVIEDDGRRYLRRTAKLYDVISSEPSNPWIAGVSHLFTAEFFTLARSRLAPGGVYCQWFHAYNMPEDALRTGLATFRAAFPHAMLWRWNTDLLLIGSERPLALDWDELERRLTAPEVAVDLAPMGLGHVPDLLAHWTLDSAGLAALAADGPRPEIHSDDRPALEFSAPKGLRRGGLSLGNLALLERFSRPLSPQLAGAQTRWLVRALLSANRPQAAESELALLSSQDLWHSGLQRDLGEMYLRSNRPQDALRVFAARRKNLPQDPRAILDTAWASLESGDWQAAARDLELFARRENAPALRRLARRADREARPALRYLAVGLGYTRVHEGPTAARAFARVLALDPSLLVKATWQ